MIRNFEILLNDSGVSIPLVFKEVTPIEFTEVEKVVEVEAHRHCMSEAEESVLLKWIDDNGEDIDPEQWVIVHEGEVDYNIEDKLQGYINKLELATVPSSSPSKGSEQDTPLFKIRYVYAPPFTGHSKSGESREFCIKMVKAGKVYRKEDIEAAENKVLNPGFGPRGSDTYSIWLWKGSVSCHHYWMRQIYLRRNNKRISVNEARRMITALPVDERDDHRFEVNDPKVATIPFDMPRHGALPK